MDDVDDQRTPPLRFGVMCRGLRFDVWQASAISKLIEGGDAVPALLIIDSRDSPSSSAAGRLLKMLFKPRLFWRLFQRVCRPSAQRSVDLSALLQGVPRRPFYVEPVGRFGERLSPEDVAEIRSHDLDFILRFGFGILRGDVLSAARYGIWSFHHGDERRYRGGPPCFWEIYRSDPVTGAILQRLTDRLDAGVVLRKCHLKTIDYSYARAVDDLFLETSDWPAYVAGEIRRGVTAHVQAPPSASNAPIFRAPSNLAVVRFSWILAKNAFRHLLRRHREEEWNVGVVRLRPSEVLAGALVREVQWMETIDNGWVADPIAVTENGHVHVLCERMDDETGKAHICSATFDGKSWSAPRKALDPGTHASYPYVFRYRDAYYCIPETFEANAVKLYRAQEFPATWEFVTTLLDDVAAVDSTVFEFGERLWLLCTTRQASATRLYAYYADDLLGPWKPHARNPIKIDVRGSRPAGPPFLHDGVLYRPAQDCSRSYGGRVVIQRVLSLTPDAFAEAPQAFVEPDPRGPYREGLHTISFAGVYCVVDGKRPRRR